MKKFIIISFLIFGLSVALKAQNQKIAKIENMEELQSSTLIYYFEDFQLGVVSFKNGTQSDGILNYNLLSQKIQFKQNDTIYDLKNKNTEIAFILINKVYFYPYKKEFLAVISRGTVSLLYSKKIQTENSKTGGYGTPNSTASVSNLNSAESDQLGSLNPGINYLSTKVKPRIVETFYFMKDNKIVVANKKNLMRFLPDKSDSVEKYILENNVSFYNYDDLRLLFETLNFK